MGEDLQKGGKWIEELIRQQEVIADDYPEEELVTVFPEDTVGHDNYFSYEEVRRVPNTPDDPNAAEDIDDPNEVDPTVSDCADPNEDDPNVV